MRKETISQLSEVLPVQETKRFNSIVSNPPYQMSSVNTVKYEGRDTEVVNVFQYFYEISTKICETSTMIFPGGRWMQRSHGNNAISELIFSTVSEILWFPNGEEKRIQPVFEHAAISDGVSIVCFRDDSSNSPSIIVNHSILPRPKNQEIIPLSSEANSIISKFTNYGNLNSRKIETNSFRLETNWVEQNLSQVEEYDESSSLVHEWDRVIAYLGNSTPGKNKRVQKYWLRKSAINWTPHLEKIYSSWKIVCSQGQVAKRPATSSYRIVEENTVIGASWLILGIFDTLEETTNYKKYIDTSFVRYLIEESRGGKSGKWGVFVPDLRDYTSHNSTIDWNKDLDSRLFDIFDLSMEQQETIMSKNFMWKDKAN